MWVDGLVGSRGVAEIFFMDSSKDAKRDCGEVQSCQFLFVCEIEKLSVKDKRVTAEPKSICYNKRSEHSASSHQTFPRVLQGLR